MYRVLKRFTGQFLWNSSALPMTAQSAVGQVKALRGSRFADEVHIIASRSTAGMVDLRICRTQSQFHAGIPSRRGLNPVQ